MWPKELWSLIAATFSEWNEDRVPRMAAALAFYTAFSIAPMLVIAIWIATQMFDEAAVAAEVSQQLRLLMGPTAAKGVETMLTSARHTGGGWPATILGVLLLVYGSTNVFAEIQDSMNTIWEVKARPGKLWWQIIRDRLVSFAMVLALAFLLMVSLVLSAALAALSRYVSSGVEFWTSAVNSALSLVVFTVVFALIFKYLPDVKIRWPEVVIGAVVTSLLFNLGKLLIAQYLGRESVSSVYGAAGSLAILLLWVYYSAQILYIGAEFTQVYTRRRRGRKQVEPERGAVAITEEERIQQGIPHRATVEGAAEKQAAEGLEE
jgi:membrane protein